MGFHFFLFSSIANSTCGQQIHSINIHLLIMRENKKMLCYNEDTNGDLKWESIQAFGATARTAEPGGSYPWNLAVSKEPSLLKSSGMFCPVLLETSIKGQSFSLAYSAAASLETLR